MIQDEKKIARSSWRGVVDSISTLSWLFTNNTREISEDASGALTPVLYGARCTDSIISHPFALDLSSSSDTSISYIVRNLFLLSSAPSANEFSKSRTHLLIKSP